MNRKLFIFLMVSLLFLHPAHGEDAPSTTVGLPRSIDELVLPGSELEVKPIDGSEPIVLRIAGTFKHGDSFRYNLVFYGLEPGEYDLRNYLRRMDGSDTSNLPPIPVIIESILPPGQVLPHDPEAKTGPFRFYYRVLIGIGITVWVIGLLLILFYRKGRFKRDDAAAARPMTIAQKLEPLVKQAISGNLTHNQLADLERSLLHYWRKKLQLDEMKTGPAMGELRGHAEAGPLILQMEKWLHQPGKSEDVDVAELLRPYEKLPVEEWEAA